MKLTAKKKYRNSADAIFCWPCENMENVLGSSILTIWWLRGVLVGQNEVISQNLWNIFWNSFDFRSKILPNSELQKFRNSKELQSTREKSRENYVIDKKGTIVCQKYAFETIHSWSGLDFTSKIFKFQRNSKNFLWKMTARRWPKVAIWSSSSSVYYLGSDKIYDEKFSR